MRNDFGFAHGLAGHFLCLFLPYPILPDLSIHLEEQNRGHAAEPKKNTLFSPRNPLIFLSTLHKNVGAKPDLISEGRKGTQEGNNELKKA